MTNELIQKRYRTSQMVRSVRMVDKPRKHSDRERIEIHKRRLNAIEKIDLEVWPTANYYVTPNGKGDGKTPFSAMSMEEFEKADLQDGDIVAFERGQVFNGFGDYTVLVNNVVFRSYGTGADPIFRGSDDMTSLTWTHTGSNIYSATWANPFYWIFKDGVASKLCSTQWYPTTLRSSASTFTAPSAAGVWGSTLIGAQVIIKSYYFTNSLMGSISAWNNGTGQFTMSNVGFTPTVAGFHVKFFNQLQFLDEVNEFFYNAGTTTVYYKTAGGAPTGDLRICRKNYAIKINDSVSGFNCIGLNFTQYYNCAIQGKLTNSTKIQNCTFTDIKQNSIFLWGNATGVEVTGNTVIRCGQNGMLFGCLVSPTVSSNTISYIGMDANIPIPQVIGATLSDWEQTEASGIVFTYDITNSAYGVSGGYVQYNYVHHVGYCGINFTGSLTEVSYNRVDECMLTQQDGSAIYCVSNPQSPYFTQTSNTLIKKNILTNIRGKYDQCPVSHPLLNTWGIYVDYQCDAISIIDNTVINSEGGIIKINYANRNNIITGNVGTGGTYGIIFNNDAVLYYANTGNTFTGNLIATSFYPISIFDLNGVTTYNPFTSGTSNNNWLVNPYGDVAGRRLTSPATSYTMATFRSTYGGDAGSVGYPLTIINYSGEFAREQEVFYHLNETMSSVSYTIPTGYVDKNNVTAGNSVTIPAYEGIALFKTASVATIWDAFSGTNGTSISAHTPNVGGAAWTLRHGAIVIASSSTVTATTNGNATQTTANSDVNLLSTASRGSNASGTINLIARHNGLSGTANENYIWVKWASDLIQVIEHTAPSTDVVLTSAQQELSASSYFLECQIVGSRIKVRVSGEERIDFTGLTMNPSSTIHGIRCEVFTSSFVNTCAFSNP